MLFHSGSNVSHGLSGERIGGHMPVYGLGAIERMGLGAVCPRQDMKPASRYPLWHRLTASGAVGDVWSSSLDGVTLGHCDSTLISRSLYLGLNRGTWPRPSGNCGGNLPLLLGWK